MSESKEIEELEDLETLSEVSKVIREGSLVHIYFNTEEFPEFPEFITVIDLIPGDSFVKVLYEAGCIDYNDENARYVTTKDVVMGWDPAVGSVDFVMEFDDITEAASSYLRDRGILVSIEELSKRIIRGGLY